MTGIKSGQAHTTWNVNSELWSVGYFQGWEEHMGQSVLCNERQECHLFDKENPGGGDGGVWTSHSIQNRVLGGGG